MDTELSVTGSVSGNLKKEKISKILTVIAAVVLVLAVAILIVRYITYNNHVNLEGGLYSQDEPSKSLVEANPDSIPDYTGEDVIELRANLPNFTFYDFDHIKGENYMQLDPLRRCGTAYALLDRTMMPADERGEIGSIKPTGWKQEKYPGIVDSDPPYLYNRCHLIAYALTGQNANELNLITGTRHFNSEVMLPYEIKVMRYLDHSDNHVLYRITPYFKGNELVARGVEMEAYSIEDNGEGVCFHVFCYNVQPGIEIDYATGENRQQMKRGNTVE